MIMRANKQNKTMKVMAFQKQKQVEKLELLDTEKARFKTLISVKMS